MSDDQDRRELLARLLGERFAKPRWWRTRKTSFRPGGQVDEIAGADVQRAAERWHRANKQGQPGADDEGEQR